MFRKIFIILMLSVLVSACGDDEVKAFDPTEHVRPVKTYEVTSVKKIDVRTYPGKVRAGKKVDVSFIVSGPLVELNIKEGDYVKQGKLIARIDPASFKHNLSSIEAQLEEATLAYSRAEKLWVAKAISKADYDRAKSAYNVLSSKKRLVAKSLKDTYLSAPFSGYIAKRYVDNYQTVQAGMPIVSVQNIKDIEVVVNVPETLVMNASYIKDFDAYAVFEVPSKQEHKMEIKEIGTEADPVTQTYPVKFSMPSPSDINVLPGMTLAAKIVIKETYKEGVFEVPESAVFSDSSSKTFVWKVSKDMKVAKSEVAIDGMHEDKILVTAGLAEGEEIASAGIQHLSEGMEIKRLEKSGNVK